MIYWTQAGGVLAGHDWLQIKRRGSKRRPGGIWLDNIFSLDTETTSAFRTPEGDIIPFDFEKPESFWQHCDKFGWVWIWMIGVDEHVFYGRTLPELHSFLELLDDLTDHAEKIFFIHNAAFDFQFIRDALPFSRVFARTKRKVLTADCEELHLHFRCSYFLVNMSLANWAKSKKLSVQKLEGDLDYLKIRTPLSPVTDQELAYCEHDILVMQEGLKQYRDKYLNVFRIPLTQTGETRIALAEVMKDETSWKRKMQQLIPHSLADYRFLMSAFFGGDVHANYYLADRLLHGIRSCDFASSYPWVLISSGQFPLSYFTRITKNRERFMDNPRYVYIISFDAFNIRSKLHNTFLSRSRCTMALDAACDNGRIVSARFVQCTMTNIDFEMFRDYYEIGQLNILDFRVSVAGYLNPTYCRFILECYEGKTVYKGVPEMHEVYCNKKVIANGCYGDCVTRDFENDTTWSPTADWGIELMTEERYQEKAAIKRRNEPRNYKATQLGVFVTAIARRNLWRYMIEPLDHQVAYFDTDCVKFKGNDIQGAISSYNMLVLREHYKIAERLGVDVSRLSPADPSGKVHPIGCAELEAVYADFKTCGAKKYACREEGGPIEITIAGVPKGCASVLRSVDDLSDDLRFPPSNEPGQKKSILHYLDDQPELIVDGWKMDSPHGICLQPTGYKVGLTAEYMALILQNMELYTEDFTNVWDAEVH